MQEVQTENKATRNTTGQRISTRKMDGNKRKSEKIEEVTQNQASASNAKLPE